MHVDIDFSRRQLGEKNDLRVVTAGDLSLVALADSLHQQSVVHRAAVDEKKHAVCARL